MRMADDDRFAKEGVEWVGDGREPWCILDEGFGNAMQATAAFGMRQPGLTRLSKRCASSSLPPLRRVAPICTRRAFRASNRVEDDGIQSKERR